MTGDAGSFCVTDLSLLGEAAAVLTMLFFALVTSFAPGVTLALADLEGGPAFLEVVGRGLSVAVLGD